MLSRDDVPVVHNTILLCKITALIISHGHFDHYGGLIGFLDSYREKLPPSISITRLSRVIRTRRGKASSAHVRDWHLTPV